jgi:hypothetical protein
MVTVSSRYWQPGRCSALNRDVTVTSTHTHFIAMIPYHQFTLDR